jgi:phosphoserine/homoserine phosphotransferase
MEVDESPRHGYGEVKRYMHLVCSDLEGIFLPEIWIKFAEKTGIPELRLTTRDISDYDVLMQHRLKILKQHGLKLADIQAVIATMDPLEGALEFLDWLRSVTQILVVSDTFVQFAGPLMQKLGFPTLLCNSLAVAADGTIDTYVMRQKDGKKSVAHAMQSLNYTVIGVGDSYNDIAMLQAADHGILYRPPENVRRQYPDFPVASGFDELRGMIQSIIGGDGGRR